MTEQEKITARFGLIMQSTSKAQGDLGRNMDSPTNKIRTMKQQAEQLGIQFGQVLMPSFTFGNKNSYTDFGILIAKRPNIPLPKRRVSNIIIPGRSSSLKFDEGTYGDITITKNNFTIYNEGTFESQPVIKVYGSGDIKLKINDDEVTVKKGRWICNYRFSIKGCI